MPLYVFIAYWYVPNLPQAGVILLTTQPKYHPTQQMGEKKHTVLPFPPFFWTVMHKLVQNKTIYTLIHNMTSNNPSDRFSSTYFLQCQRVTKCANISEKSYPSSIKNSRHVGLPCIIILHLSTINYSTIIKH